MSHDNQFALLATRRFGPFFMTQFLGAFNDNVYKNALLIMLAYQVADRFAVSSGVLINMAAGLFILPFFLFSATAGHLADKYDKAFLIRLVKLAEIVIMGFAAVALWTDSVVALILLLFLMGAQSSLFGPVKYGILPQLLDERELLGGNGLVEMGTFVAILLGTALGGILIGIDETGRYMVGVAVVIIAVLGYASARGVPALPAVDPGTRVGWNPLTETWHIMGYAREHRSVFLSVVGISWFWFLGSLYLAQLPNFSLYYLGGNEEVVTLLLALFSVGVGGGSLLCERLSGRRIDIGLVPFGSIGLTLFGLDLALMDPLDPVPLEDELIGVGLWLSTPGAWRVVMDVLLLGLFGGFYIVPLYASVQQRTDARHRARVIAANNVLNALFMVLGALFAVAVLGSGFSIANLFLVMALANAFVAVYIYTQAPEFVLRFLTWVLVHLLYRIRVQGARHVPDEGAALLVCNHVSYVDALIIGGCIRRPVRFVMYHRFYNLPLLRFLFNTAGAIPIAPAKEDPALLANAYERIDEALARGEVVCLFPEGRLTESGELQPFRPGIENIIRRRPVPVVPMALRGLWGSFFSRAGAGAMRRLPKPLWYRVELLVSRCIPAAQVTVERVEADVAALLNEAPAAGYNSGL